MLTERHGCGDNFALTKSLPIAVQWLCLAGLALSVIASQCHLSQGERLLESFYFYLYTPKAPGGYPPGAFGIDRTMTGE